MYLIINKCKTLLVQQQIPELSCKFLKKTEAVSHLSPPVLYVEPVSGRRPELRLYSKNKTRPVYHPGGL